MRRAAPIAFTQAVLWGTSALMLYPIVVMAFSGFRSTGEIFGTPFALPDFAHISHFLRILSDGAFLGYFANSVVVTTGAVLLSVTLAHGGLCAGTLRFRRRHGALSLSSSPA